MELSLVFQKVCSFFHKAPFLPRPTSYTQKNGNMQSSAKNPKEYLLVIGPQITLETFQNQKEIDDWIKEKVGDSSKHKLHSSNWQLCEYWYEFDKGVNHDTKKSKIEKMDQTANNAGAAHALGLEESGSKKKGMSMEEKHKLWMTKSRNLIQKLSRGINTYESHMPSLRRSTSGDSYAKLKAGINQCRLLKDDALEELEDQKLVTQINEEEVQKVMEVHSRVCIWML